MSELGNPLSQRMTFFLAPEAGDRQSNAQYFVIDRGALPANGIALDLDIRVENLGTADVKVKIDTSAYTGNPSFEPFVSTYGTAFTSSFSALANVTVKPGGQAAIANAVVSTKRFFVIYVDTTFATSAPVKITISPNVGVSYLN